jgi:hypothetical protein
LGQVLAVTVLITAIGYAVERFAFAPAEGQMGTGHRIVSPGMMSNFSAFQGKIPGDSNESPMLLISTNPLHKPGFT